MNFLIGIDAYNEMEKQIRKHDKQIIFPWLWFVCLFSFLGRHFTLMAQNVFQVQRDLLCYHQTKNTILDDVVPGIIVKAYERPRNEQQKRNDWRTAN